MKISFHLVSGNILALPRLRPGLHWSSLYILCLFSDYHCRQFHTFELSSRALVWFVALLRGAVRSNLDWISFVHTHFFLLRVDFFIISVLTYQDLVMLDQVLV